MRIGRHLLGRGVGDGFDGGFGGCGRRIIDEIFRRENGRLQEVLALLDHVLVTMVHQQVVLGLVSFWVGMLRNLLLYT